MLCFFRVICMARQARKKSVSNIYHVMLRGINRQVIFEDDGDKRYFISVMGECKEASGFKLHAFCLMDNHVHLLIEPVGEPIEQIFRRIGSRYVIWYNKKYQRVGNLFQDRFKSECVDTDQYFRIVLRYILQNPMKAGYEKEPGHYRWSSYLAYQKGGGSLTDTDYTEKLFADREAMVAFLQEVNDDEAMDEKENQWRLQDDEAKKIIRDLTNCSSVAEFQQLDMNMKKAYAVKLYIMKLTVNQISRLTGMARTTIQRTVNKIQPDVLEERKNLRLHEPEESEFSFPEEIW